MNKYVGLLRGVNVGGKSRVVMPELKDALAAEGLVAVSTYINSGNIIFSSTEKDSLQLSQLIKSVVKSQFDVESSVVVVEAKSYIDIVDSAPDWWGQDKSWKHNLIFLVSPATTTAVIEAIGELKPGIELIEAVKGVIYQSMSFEKFGQTTSGRLASNSIYKQLTIRNFNTAQKLKLLLENEQNML